MVDDCTRECLALIADTSLSGAGVARELAPLFDTRGKPQTVVSDADEVIACVCPPTIGHDLWRKNVADKRSKNSSIVNIYQYINVKTLIMLEINAFSKCGLHCRLMAKLQG